MSLAPIILFTYNRLEHTRKTISALCENILASKSDLYVFSDGAKNENDNFQISILREFLHNVKGFNSVTVFEREINMGLSENIINGVSDICNRFGKAIVLEDDIITSPYFLLYMNEAIDKYIENPNVCCIHGYVYPTNFELPDIFFIKGADCWGWATWSSAWNKFETNGSKLLSEIKSKKLEKEFNFNNSFDYVKMLEDQVQGINNSWAVRWYASCFLNNLYTLYPGKSLVSNIGFDGTGTHSGLSEIYNQTYNKAKVEIFDIPVKNNEIAYNAFVKYFRANNFYSSKFKKYLKILLPRQILSIYRKL